MPSTAVDSVCAATTQQQDDVRVRDSDLDPSQFDPDTGEYFQRPSATSQLQKQAANAWVSAALKGRQISERELVNK
jgi:hypothetical protein